MNTYLLTEEQLLAEEKKLEALIAKQESAKQKIEKAKAEQAKAKAEQTRIARDIEAIKKDRSYRDKEARMQIGIDLAQAFIRAAKDEYDINEYTLQRILTKYLPSFETRKEYGLFLSEMETAKLEPEEAKSESTSDLENAFAKSKTEAI